MVAIARRWGPSQGAGVVLQEKAGNPSIVPGARGLAGYTGVTERGPVGLLSYCDSIKTYNRKYGNGSLAQLAAAAGGPAMLPDAVADYFKHSNGAGGVWVMRVTDGTEVAAVVTLSSRHAVPVPVGTLTARNGGAWAGRRLIFRGQYSSAGNLTNTVFTTGVNARWKTNQLAGARVTFEDAPGKAYTVVSNTAAGVLTFTADATALTDSGSQTAKTYFIDLPNTDAYGADNYLAVVITDGAKNPAGEFGITVYVDGILLKTWPDLSMDPLAINYWQTIVNQDPDNFFITVANGWSGSGADAAARPANLAGTAGTLAATTLNLPGPTSALTLAPAGVGNGTVSSYTYGADVRPQVLTLTFTSATVFTVSSTIMGGAAALQPNGAVGTPYVANSAQGLGFIVTAGSSAFETGDVFTIDASFFPEPNVLAGGYVYPNTAAAPRTKYRILSNTARQLVAVPGSDLTRAGADTTGTAFRVEYPQQGWGGYDGQPPAAANFQALLQTDTSPWSNLAGLGQGLVKLATPGVLLPAVQKAGAALAAALNYQFRYEVDPAQVAETDGENYVSQTLGRSIFAVTTFPSYAMVIDPRPGSAALIQRTLTGMIHGREALFALTAQGYHQPAAGTDATLPDIQDMLPGFGNNRVFNQEVLNPRGLGTVKKSGGNWCIWGDRTVFDDTAWLWKHMREQMSGYEHDLLENFDWIIFKLNDPDTVGDALAALDDYFTIEGTKGALNTSALGGAGFLLAIDKGNNTAADGAAGNLNADIQLAFVNVVERFIITVGQAGVGEATV